MSDAIDDLSALRIERAPAAHRRTPLGPLGGAAACILAGAGGGAYWWTHRVVPLEVEVARSRSRAAGTQASVLNASGYVTARRRATVSSKVTGKVVEVNVEEGMAVREGQVLARLDDSTVRAMLEPGAGPARSRRAGRSPSRRSGWRRRELNLGRRERLFKEQLATAADMDQAQAEVNSFDRPHRLAARADRRGGAAGGAAADGARRHGHPGAVQRRGAQQGRPARRDGVAGVGRRRLHAHRHQHHRRHAIAGDRGRRQRELHQPRHRQASRSPPSSTPTRTSRSRPRSSPWCRPPTGRRPRCWCASASTSSTRASCPTWA